MIYLKIAVTLGIIVAICAIISGSIAQEKPFTFEEDKSYQTVACVGSASFIGVIVSGIWWLWNL